MKKLYISIIACLSLIACDDEKFLDHTATKSAATEIKTVEDLDKLFNGLTFGYTQDYVNVFSTDNASLPQSILDETSAFSDQVISEYTLATEVNRDKDTNWQYHYEELLLPNLTLELLESGELEGDDEHLIAQLKAESHFIRALSLFELAVVYCLPNTAANANEPGLVLKKTSSLEEDLSRATVKETFDFILAELDEALKYPEVEKKSMFRIGLSSVHALAARVNLYLGDFDKAEYHAGEALAGMSEMVDYGTELYTLSYSLYYGPYVYPNTATFGVYNITIPTFFDDQYYYVSSNNPGWNTSPSQELLDLYDPADMRNLFFVDGWFSRLGATTETWTTYMQTNVGNVLSGPGVAEMYLTRAECKARNDDFTGAMADVEMVRINRFAAADYAALAIPSDAKSAVELIIDERRREDPFEYRFMDIKRLNQDPLTDPIVLTRVINGETITINPDDRVWARPIGEDVISASIGQTKQNTY